MRVHVHVRGSWLPVRLFDCVCGLIADLRVCILSFWLVSSLSGAVLGKSLCATGRGNRSTHARASVFVCVHVYVRGSWLPVRLSDCVCGRTTDLRVCILSVSLVGSLRGGVFVKSLCATWRGDRRTHAREPKKKPSNIQRELNTAKDTKPKTSVNRKTI